jgi:epoxyqueuosine reductase
MMRVAAAISSDLVCRAARESGFDLAGVAGAGGVGDFPRFRSWADRGLAGEMGYLTDRRGGLRSDPAELLAGVRSIVCVALVYNGPEPVSTEFSDPERGWIARYAWGEDYHGIIRAKLEGMARKLSLSNNEYRVCVDTTPLLERSLARDAGLGWIGKNTCLINQGLGSWFFLGELLTTLELEPDSPAPDRCGSCTRCIEACPTAAIVPSPDGRYELDARLCISYFTIELRGAIPEEHRAEMGAHVFGCDICQDVCPWNRPPNRSPARTNEARFGPREFAPPLERMAALSEAEFRELFRSTPVSRAKYAGFLRNVAVAMGNAGLPKFREPLEKLAGSGDELVAEHARWAIGRLANPQKS